MLLLFLVLMFVFVSFAWETSFVRDFPTFASTNMTAGGAKSIVSLKNGWTYIFYIITDSSGDRLTCSYVLTSLASGTAWQHCEPFAPYIQGVHTQASSFTAELHAVELADGRPAVAWIDEEQSPGMRTIQFARAKATAPGEFTATTVFEDQIVELSRTIFPASVALNPSGHPVIALGHCATDRDPSRVGGDPCLPLRSSSNDGDKLFRPSIDVVLLEATTMDGSGPWTESRDHIGAGSTHKYDFPDYIVWNGKPAFALSSGYVSENPDRQTDHTTSPQWAYSSTVSGQQPNDWTVEWVHPETEFVTSFPQPIIVQDKPVMAFSAMTLDSGIAGSKQAGSKQYVRVSVRDGTDSAKPWTTRDVAENAVFPHIIQVNGRHLMTLFYRPEKGAPSSAQPMTVEIAMADSVSSTWIPFSDFVTSGVYTGGADSAKTGATVFVCGPGNNQVCVVHTEGLKNHARQLVLKTSPLPIPWQTLSTTPSPTPVPAKVTLAPTAANDPVSQAPTSPPTTASAGRCSTAQPGTQVQCPCDGKGQCSFGLVCNAEQVCVVPSSTTPGPVVDGMFMIIVIIAAVLGGLLLVVSVGFCIYCLRRQTDSTPAPQVVMGPVSSMDRSHRRRSRSSRNSGSSFRGSSSYRPHGNYASGPAPSGEYSSSFLHGANNSTVGAGSMYNTGSTTHLQRGVVQQPSPHYVQVRRTGSRQHV